MDFSDLHGWSMSDMNVQVRTCDGLLVPYRLSCRDRAIAAIPFYAGEDQHRNRNARLALSVQFSRGAPRAWGLLSGGIRAFGHDIGQDHIGFVGPRRGPYRVPEPSSVAVVPEH